jgi:hypothetical protein
MGAIVPPIKAARPRRGPPLPDTEAARGRSGYRGGMTGPSRAGRDTGRPLWSCPRCARTFANVRQTHTCAPLTSLDAHFEGKAPDVRASFDRMLEAVRECGPVTVLPERTRIALHVRMSFAALVPRKRWLDGHLVLARRVDSPRFRWVEEYSARNVLHAFRLVAPADVDAEFRAWLAQAYQVGEQRHLDRPPAP